MAEPGAPKTPDDHDDLIGFTSPKALAGVDRPRAAEPQPQAEASGGDRYDKDLFQTPDAAPASSAQAAPEIPAWARETPRPAAAAPTRAFGKAGQANEAEAPEGAMVLFAIYALILFAVPTLGVSAAIALFAVMTRTPPQQALALSHFEYQKRTLLIGAGGAVLGVALILVNLGVFVLFFLALWVLARGALGLFRLSARQPIAKPQTFFF